MGKGIEMARAMDPMGAAAMENLRDDLLIVFLQRLGGEVRVPVEEIDDTPRGKLMTLRLEGKTFVFSLTRKQ